MTTESTCDQNALIGWLDESLPAASRASVRDHLSVCDSCRQRLQSLESTLELARDLAPAAEMGPFEARAFVHKVRGRIAAREQTLWRRLLSPAAGGGFASGAVVGALSLFFALGGLQEPGVETEAAPNSSSSIEIEGSSIVLEAADEEERWAGVIDEYLIDTASEVELFNEMESLIGEEDLFALLAEY